MPLMLANSEVKSVFQTDVSSHYYHIEWYLYNIVVTKVWVYSRGLLLLLGMVLRGWPLTLYPVAISNNKVSLFLELHLETHHHSPGILHIALCIHCVGQCSKEYYSLNVVSVFHSRKYSLIVIIITAH